ncbi:MAG: DNA-processing protein DprA, partial [Spirochaetaceae bacterium]|nr:DNA-processing protein DprA [Spirochaetaceae bacterium]
DVETIVGKNLSKRDWDLDGFRVLAEKDAATARMRGIGYASYMSPDYPPLLREIWDPPSVLFYRGELPNPNQSLIAIVGTREPSPPALSQAYTIAKDLAREGIPVVSGLARGIDAMAHRGNSDGGAPTIAVLASGLDEVFPALNRTLARRIMEQGGVLLSEYPPGTRPEKWHFPARNRIVSALARGTLVVEAPAVSGALITARFALEQGRDVWVASSGVDEKAPYAAQRGGTKKLAEEGAPVISSFKEILKEWGMTTHREDREYRENEAAPMKAEGFSASALAFSLAQSLNITCEELCRAKTKKQ